MSGILGGDLGEGSRDRLNEFFFTPSLGAA